LLVEHLNEDPEIAFLVPPDGEPAPGGVASRRGRVFVGEADRLTKMAFPAVPGWSTVRTVASLGDGKHSLWHAPAGKGAPGHTIGLDLWTRYRPYSAEERAAEGRAPARLPLARRAAEVLSLSVER
jgi:hypothetical protein